MTWALKKVKPEVNPIFGPKDQENKQIHKFPSHNIRFKPKKLTQIFLTHFHDFFACSQADIVPGIMIKTKILFVGGQRSSDELEKQKKQNFSFIGREYCVTFRHTWVLLNSMNHLISPERKSSVIVQWGKVR